MQLSCLRAYSRSVKPKSKNPTPIRPSRSSADTPTVRLFIVFPIRAEGTTEVLECAVRSGRASVVQDIKLFIVKFDLAHHLKLATNATRLAKVPASGLLMVDRGGWRGETGA